MILRRISSKILMVIKSKSVVTLILVLLSGNFTGLHAQEDENTNVEFLVDMDLAPKDDFTRLPGDYLYGNFSFPGFAIASPNREHVALFFKKDKSHILYLDDKILAQDYKALFETSYNNRWVHIKPTPIFSDNSEHIIKAAQKKNNKWVLLFDGVEITDEFDAIITYGYSRDSLHTFCIARQGKTYAFLRDGKVIASQFKLLSFMDRQPEVKFTSSIDHFILAVKNLQKKNVVINDGKESEKSFDDIRHLAINPDGSQIAYAVKNKGKWQIVLQDTVLQDVYDDILYVGYSKSGKHFYYCAELNKEYFYVIDGNTQPKFSALTMLHFSYDDSLWGYCGLKYKTGIKAGGDAFGTFIVNGETVYTDELKFEQKFFISGIEGISDSLANALLNSSSLPGGIINTESEQSSNFYFHPNNAGVHFLNNGKGYICLAFQSLKKDNKEPVRFDALGALHISGSEMDRLVYLALDKDYIVENIDGINHKLIEGKKWGGWGLSSFNISDDGKKTAYCFKEGGDYDLLNVPSKNSHKVFWDQKLQYEIEKALKLSDLIISPDNMHIAFRVRESESRSFIVIDGKPVMSPSFNFIIEGSLRFINSDTLSYFATQGTKVFRVTQKI